MGIVVVGVLGASAGEAARAGLAAELLPVHQRRLPIKRFLAGGTGPLQRSFRRVVHGIAPLFASGRDYPPGTGSNPAPVREGGESLRRAARKRQGAVVRRGRWVMVRRTRLFWL